MLLMNYKVELRLKWTNHYVLSESVNDNDDTNSNNVIFIIKDSILFLLSSKTIISYKNF